MTATGSHPSMSPAPWVMISGGFHRRGGMDRANWALASHLAERGTPLHLVAHHVDPQLALQPRITVHLVPRAADSYLLGEFQLGWRGREVAASVMRQDPAARVLINGSNCPWPGINWVHCVHHVWRPRDAGAPAWFRLKNRLTAAIARRRERAALARANIVIANSNRTRSDLIRTLGIDPAHVHTVYPGSDSHMPPASQAERAEARAWLGIPNDRPLAVFVGVMGYDSNKGFDTLVAAWRNLNMRGAWDVDLIAAGGGRGSAAWSKRISLEHLSARIRLLGFTDRIPALLAAADLLVSPVRYEGYGMNVQEALCRGVPAMVSQSAGIAERFPCNLRELLIDDPDSVAELTARLLRWRAKILEWKDQVIPFSETLRRHSWTLMCERILAICESTPSRCLN